MDLRDVPSAVGGDESLRHGIVLAKSVPAKAYGVRTGETLLEARRKCPGLKVVSPNYGLYEQCSAALMDMLREYSDAVEQYSIDEAFADMTRTCHLFGGPKEAADRIRGHIKKELGFTVNVGVSSNKLLAKMASDFRKPDRVHTLYPHEIRQKMWPLPVSELFFVGHATAKKLFSVGIRTIGELAETDPAWLKSILKKQGEVIWAFANGMDQSPVLDAPPPNKGYGNSTTLPRDVTGREEAEKVLLALSETVAARLRADQAQARVVSVGIKYDDLSYVSRQKTLAASTNLTVEICREARELFARLWNQRPVRLLGVHAGQVQREELYRQADLFDPVDYEKLAMMDGAVDAIRRRFGRDAVMRAAFLDGSVNHMCGGVSNAAGPFAV